MKIQTLQIMQIQNLSIGKEFSPMKLKLDFPMIEACTWSQERRRKEERRNPLHEVET